MPPEGDGDKDAYIDRVCREMMPAIARDHLADAVDAFCEEIAFTPEQVARVFAAAKAAGVPVKLHADQRTAVGYDYGPAFQGLAAAWAAPDGTIYAGAAPGATKKRSVAARPGDRSRPTVSRNVGLSVKAKPPPGLGSSRNVTRSPFASGTHRRPAAAPLIEERSDQYRAGVAVAMGGVVLDRAGRGGRRGGGSSIRFGHRDLGVRGGRGW